MANIIIPPKWRIVPERETTPEEIFNGRRAFLARAGIASAFAIGGGAAAAAACADDPVNPVTQQPQPKPGLYPPGRNEKYELDRPLTKEEDAGSYNNFYEFANRGFNFKGRVKELAKDYPFRPWEIEISGLCEKPQTLSIDEIEALAPIEERLYRHRCVEAWSMAVPWAGYSLSKLLDAVQPTSGANYVRFISWLDADLPGVREPSDYKWPYYEGLRMDEAMNEITLLCTGIYGKPLAPQHGAPVRIVTPWKYGYKSIKSIVKIELTAEKPPTFWNDASPTEYDFLSNVNPEVPHPRWSQATEWMIPDGSTRRPTLLYNGYGDYVADMYA